MDRAPSRSAWLVAGLLLLVSPAFAAQVYRWQDANGVTHYTDRPPERDHGARPSATAKPASTRPAVNVDCWNARGNLNALRGTADIGVDENGDGKPDRVLRPAERAARMKRAEAQIDTYCGAALDARG